MGAPTKPSLASGKVLLGNASNEAAHVTLSGDLTTDNAGVTAIGTEKVLSAMVSPLLVQYKKVSLTTAEAVALNTAPKTLVAAAAGYTTVIHQALLVLNYAGAAITANGVVGLFETDSAGVALSGTLTLASFLGAGADVQKWINAPAGSATVGITRLDNKAVVLSQATGDSTIGASTSTVDVHLWYSVIPHLL